MPGSLYKVATQAVAAEVNFVGGARAFGDMFLRPSIVTASGIECVADRLNDRDAFFPLRVHAPEPSTWIVGKHQVRYVAADHTPALTGWDGADQASAVTFAVHVELDAGETLHGEFRAALPRGKQRLLDFINDQEGPFVALVTGERQYVLNRAYIRVLRDGGR